MRRFAPVAAVILAAALAACGTPPHDLFIVERGGTIEGAKLRLRVRDDGSVTCNGVGKEMPSRVLILARVLSRDLAKPVKQRISLPGRPGSTLRYAFRVEDGVTRFSDNSSGQPQVFYRAALLVRRIAKEACGLPR